MISDIRHGSLVKIRIGYECIWTQVTTCLDFGFRGVFTNEPVTFEGKLGDPIEFTPAMVVDVHRGPPPLVLVKSDTPPSFQ